MVDLGDVVGAIKKLNGTITVSRRPAQSHTYKTRISRRSLEMVRMEHLMRQVMHYKSER